jgi:hypothetical protein
VCIFSSSLSPVVKLQCHLLYLLEHKYDRHTVQEAFLLLPPLDSALGERGHRCHFAWVSFSSSVDAYPFAW